MVSPYYCEDGNRVIFSYPGYNQLHTMFKNICAREKFHEFDNLPTQILVPHFFESMIDFEAICVFVIDRLESMQKAVSVKDPNELQH